MSYWNSWSDFLAMGGYGLYVWGSVLMTIVLMVGEVVAVRSRRKSQLEMQRRWGRNTRRESNENKI
jgi:heme exporter protein D